jgi:plasmid stabilization system protein ParE
LIRGRRLRLTAAAEQDLDEIDAFILGEAGARVADKFADRLDSQLARLARLGHSGVSREWVASGLRLHLLGNHAVYFRVTEIETVIVRIVHQRMDVESLTFGPPEF